MRSKFFTLLALGTVTTVGWAQNLYTNPGFETATTGWKSETQTGNVATLGLSAEAAHSGSYGARMAVTTADGTNWHVQLKGPSNWTATSGMEYHLTFWAKASGSLPVHIAATDGSASNYTYRSGVDCALTTAWKQCEITYVADQSGVGAVLFNLYVGSSVGTYDFDDFSLTASSAALPATIAVPVQSAWASKTHRNIFAEMGKSQTEIDAKVNAAFAQLFEGDADLERVFYTVGTDMGYIKDINNGDIRSEGQSYGMMIAVMMDRQDIFDKLWNFAKTYMQHASGDRQGYFAWQMNATAPYTAMDPNPAPDGEEYFAMSLFFASKRWGDKTGTYAYSTEANAILKAMVQKTPNGTMVPMMNPEHKMIEFSPTAGGEHFTDPSYHLPGFYTLWSKWAAEDNAFWAAAADSSRAYFKRACHPTSGLATDYQEFSGVPKTTSYNSMSAFFSDDSWRVAMNVAMDYSWFAADSWQITQSERLLNFFDGKGAYKSRYTQDGTTEKADYQSEGHVAMNAVAALASNDPVAWKFVDAFWKQPISSGQYRYYNGLLQMMSLLHLSGKYVMWGNFDPTLSISHGKERSVKPMGQMQIRQGNVWVNGWERKVNGAR